MTDSDCCGCRKTDGRESITLTMDEAPFDDSLTLDIPDVLPDHLAGGEEAHLTQTSQGIDAFSLPGADSQASSARSYRGRKSAALNLPDSRSSMASDSMGDVLDDMSDLLLPGSPPTVIIIPAYTPPRPGRSMPRIASLLLPPASSASCVLSSQNGWCGRV